jgi:hypothetical protein
MDLDLRNPCTLKDDQLMLNPRYPIAHVTHFVDLSLKA